MQKGALSPLPTSPIQRRPIDRRFFERDEQGLLRIRRPFKNTLIPIATASAFVDFTALLATGSPIFAPFLNEVASGAAFFSTATQAEAFLKGKSKGVKTVLRIIRNLSLGAFFIAPSPFSLLSPAMLFAYTFVGSSLAIFGIKKYESIARKEKPKALGTDDLIKLESRQEGLYAFCEPLYGKDFVLIVPAEPPQHMPAFEQQTEEKASFEEEAQCQPPGKKRPDVGLALRQKARFPRILPVFLPPTEKPIPCRPSSLERFMLESLDRCGLPKLPEGKEKEISTPLVGEKPREETKPLKGVERLLEPIEQEKVNAEVRKLVEGVPESEGIASIPSEHMAKLRGAAIEVYCTKLAKIRAQLSEEDLRLLAGPFVLSGFVSGFSGEVEDDGKISMTLLCSGEKGPFELCLHSCSIGRDSWNGVPFASYKRNTYAVERLLINPPEKQVPLRPLKKPFPSISPSYLGQRCTINYLGQKVSAKIIKITHKQGESGLTAVGDKRTYEIKKARTGWVVKVAKQEAPKKEEEGLMNDDKREEGEHQLLEFRIITDLVLVAGMMEGAIKVKLGERKREKNVERIEVNSSGISIYVRSKRKEVQLCLKEGFFELKNVSHESQKGLVVEVEPKEPNEVLEFLFKKIGQSVRLAEGEKRPLYLLSRGLIDCNRKTIELDFVSSESKLIALFSKEGVVLSTLEGKVIGRFSNPKEFFDFVKTSQLI